MLLNSGMGPYREYAFIENFWHINEMFIGSFIWVFQHNRIFPLLVGSFPLTLIHTHTYTWASTIASHALPDGDTPPNCSYR